MGALRCSKCGHYDGISVRYKHAAVTWAFGGFDKEHEVLYFPIQVSGPWSRSDLPISANCSNSNCSIKFPLWQLALNKYTKPPNEP